MSRPLPLRGVRTPTVPVLTDAERARLREARPDWVPQRALRYAWRRVDPVHGHGGRCYGGRPIRPSDPGYGDGWTLAGFLAALREDECDIERVIADHPGQAPRLRAWLRRMEALGRTRTSDEAPFGAGYYYEALSELGYSYYDAKFKEWSERNDDQFS
jgi:hypothetical protein